MLKCHSANNTDSNITRSAAQLSGSDDDNGKETAKKARKDGNLTDDDADENFELASAIELAEDTP